MAHRAALETLDLVKVSVVLLSTIRVAVVGLGTVVVVLPLVTIVIRRRRGGHEASSKGWGSLQVFLRMSIGTIWSIWAESNDKGQAKWAADVL